jgi:hypothetical protein
LGNIWFQQKRYNAFIVFRGGSDCAPKLFMKDLTIKNEHSSISHSSSRATQNFVVLTGTTSKYQSGKGSVKHIRKLKVVALRRENCKVCIVVVEKRTIGGRREEKEASEVGLRSSILSKTSIK